LVFLLTLGTETWYRLQTPGASRILKWSVVLPVTDSTFQEVVLSPQELAALKCDVGEAGSWRESDGTQWTVWFLGWKSQSMISLLAARCHSPEVCLPASGRRKQAAYGTRRYRVGDLEIPFKTYTFDNGGSPLHVFFCLWQDGTEQFPTNDNLGLGGRLWAAARGMRLLGQQTLEIIIENSASFEAAEQAVRARLPELIRINRGDKATAKGKYDSSVFFAVCFFTTRY
jgi:hypothetical protein